MKIKPFYFRINPSEFLADRLIDSLSPTELGAIFRLMCRQWLDGDIPDSKDYLMRLSRLNPEEFEKAWGSIDLFFPLVSPGKRVNRFMDLEREKILDSMRAKSTSGLKASAKRWGNPVPKDIVDVEIDTKPIGSPNAIDIVIDIAKDKVISKTKTSLLSKPMTAHQSKVFNLIWDNWPKRSDQAFSKGERHLAEKSFKLLIENYGYSPDILWLTTDLYKTHPKVQEGYVKQIANFFDAEIGLYIEFIRQINEDLRLDDQSVSDRFNEAYGTKLALSSVREQIRSTMKV